MKVTRWFVIRHLSSVIALYVLRFTFIERCRVDVYAPARYTFRMAHPQIYLGQIPATSLGRRLLREQALKLAALFARPELEPSTLLLHFQPPAATHPADVLVLRPHTALVGIIQDVDGPIMTDAAGQWLNASRDEALCGPEGEPLLACIKQLRERVVAGLETATAQSFARTIGALIVAPTTHPESQIVLDIDDHRQQIKVLGLDELPTLAAMAQTGINLDNAMLPNLMADVFGAQLWHDGERLLFEISRSVLQLRVLDYGGATQHTWPLLEGANFVGRRQTPHRYEYRVALSGDDLMSNDHALIVVADDGRIVVRDTSTNGTWIAMSGEPERRLHRAERPIVPGTIMRMGATRMVLERAGE